MEEGLETRGLLDSPDKVAVASPDKVVVVSPDKVVLANPDKLVLHHHNKQAIKLSLLPGIFRVFKE